MTDDELYDAGAATLLASFEEYARGASEPDGAALLRLPGVAAAVFPAGPEHAVYNNALLARGLESTARAEALDAMEAAYAAAGVARFAAWAHESDPAMRRELERRGYVLDMTTRAMGMTLDDVRVPRPDIALVPTDWSEYLRLSELSPDFLRGLDHAAYHLVVSAVGGERVAAALAYDFAGDCGIFNVSTVEWARRRGLGTALTALQVHDAIARGRTTASLQSTQMAEGIYAAIGFRDLGRFFEYVPGQAVA